MTGRAEHTSIWVLCEDCGHTSRVLSVMASRVLKERQHCPQCQSKNAPTLHYTAAGAYIQPDEARQVHDTEHQPDIYTGPQWNGTRGLRDLFTQPFAWLRGHHS